MNSPSAYRGVSVADVRRKTIDAPVMCFEFSENVECHVKKSHRTHSFSIMSSMIKNDSEKSSTSGEELSNGSENSEDDDARSRVSNSSTVNSHGKLSTFNPKWPDVEIHEPSETVSRQFEVVEGDSGCKDERGDLVTTKPFGNDLEHKFETYVDAHTASQIYVNHDEREPKFYVPKSSANEEGQLLIDKNSEGNEKLSLRKISSFRDIVHLFSLLTKTKRKGKPTGLHVESIAQETKDEPNRDELHAPKTSINESNPQTTLLRSSAISIMTTSPTSAQRILPNPMKREVRGQGFTTSGQPSSYNHHSVFQKSGVAEVSDSSAAANALLSSSAPHSRPLRPTRHSLSLRDLRAFFKGHEETLHDPYSGHLTDRYEIVDKLGKGSSGIVRLARGLNANKLYAIKEFSRRRNRETERDMDKRVTSEFCIGSLLHHDNIVETVDIIHEGNHWYEVLEYCSGGDLFSIIRSAQMTVVEINCCFKQLIQGVAYLHSVGVAHRDIKPENILIDENGYLKLSDFGVSSVFQVAWEHEEHKFKGVCGSKPYMAPEVFSMDAYDARKVDVWACGIVFYAMNFNGVPWLSPLVSDSCYTYYLRHRDMNFNPFNRLNQDAKDLLRRILEPDPHRRLTIQEILETDWFKRIDCCVDKNATHTHRPHYHLGHTNLNKSKS